MPKTLADIAESERDILGRIVHYPLSNAIIYDNYIVRTDKVQDAYDRVSQVLKKVYLTYYICQISSHLNTFGGNRTFLDRSVYGVLLNREKTFTNLRENLLKDVLDLPLSIGKTQLPVNPKTGTFYYRMPKSGPTYWTLRHIMHYTYPWFEGDAKFIKHRRMQGPLRAEVTGIGYAKNLLPAEASECPELSKDFVEKYLANRTTGRWPKLFIEPAKKTLTKSKKSDTSSSKIRSRRSQ